MKLYLDCEFNEFKGALISMALVDENGREWYEVVSCEKPGPWVAEHVMPILGRGPVSIPLMQASLSAWLALYDSVHIVADWPEDIAHFCQALITGPGMRLNTPPLTMEVVRIDAESELPHNALADARGIRAALAAPVPPSQEARDDDDVVERFVEWLKREMPEGTVISDPAWWAPKILRVVDRSRIDAIVAAKWKKDGQHA